MEDSSSRLGSRPRIAGTPADSPTALQVAVHLVETPIYLVVAALLVVAAGFTLVGTVVDVVKGSDSRTISDTGVFMLDRILLLFIIAELLYTLALVGFRGRILVEPFLFIGLIAVVRRILVVLAETDVVESKPIDFLIEVGGLAALAVVLALSIHLLRRTATQQP